VAKGSHKANLIRLWTDAALIRSMHDRVADATNIPGHSYINLIYLAIDRQVCTLIPIMPSFASLFLVWIQ
jgi:hypothetical protein